MIVVPIQQVHYNTVTPSRWEVRRMRATLEKQGQIEPLQVRHTEHGYYVFNQDPWGAALLAAAVELKWPTLGIVVMGRYQS